MNQVEKALWYIETHLPGGITLDEVATVAGASRYHMSRVFRYATDQTLQQYIKDRRLSRAAIQLAEEGGRVIDVALSLGYNSHEGFTRAFSERFGTTPETVRSQGHVANLSLQEALSMKTKSIELSEPTMQREGEMLLAGLNRHYLAGKNEGIPEQWQTFNLREAEFVEQDSRAFGVIHNIDDEDNFDYLCAVELSKPGKLPEGFIHLKISAQTYAIFSHDGHVSDIQGVCQQAWGQWLPASGYKAVEAPFLEFYPPKFDPATGYGGFEIWIPVAD